MTIAVRAIRKKTRVVGAIIAPICPEARDLCSRASKAIEKRLSQGCLASVEDIAIGVDRGEFVIIDSLDKRHVVKVLLPSANELGVKEEADRLSMALKELDDVFSPKNTFQHQSVGTKGAFKLLIDSEGRRRHGKNGK